MNFTAAHIGIHDPTYSDALIRFGKDTGIYSDERAPPNCTPNYLPDFITIEVAKRQG